MEVDSFGQGLMGAAIMALLMGLKALFFPSNGETGEASVQKKLAAQSNAILLCLMLSCGSCIAVVVGTNSTARIQAESIKMRAEADIAAAAATVEVAKSNAEIARVLRDSLVTLKRWNEK